MQRESEYKSVSLCKNTRQPSYPQCGELHQGGISKEQKTTLSSRGTGRSGAAKEHSCSWNTLLRSYSTFCNMHTCIVSLFLSHCPFFSSNIDSLNSLIHRESHKMGLRHRELPLTNVLFTYLPFLSLAFSPVSGYLFHLAG